MIQNYINKTDNMNLICEKYQEILYIVNNKAVISIMKNKEDFWMKLRSEYIVTENKILTLWNKNKIRCPKGCNVSFISQKL